MGARCALNLRSIGRGLPAVVGRRGQNRRGVLAAALAPEGSGARERMRVEFWA